MATPSEKLAESLEALHKLQTAKGATAIRARDLGRTHRERLLKSGFLQEVMKGWYIPSRPDESRGESTAWYASFWRFAAAYLGSRFRRNWCLSPEQSLSIHAGNCTVPRQLSVRSPKGTNSVTKLPHGTSVFDLQAALPRPADRTEKDGLRLYSLEAALLEASPRFFLNYATDARAALAMVRDPTDLLGRLLDGGHSAIAGRLAGAFRNNGPTAVADEILAAMSAAGYTMRERDPFSDRPSITSLARETSPYVNRIRILWGKMRGPILDVFPKPPGRPRGATAYRKGMADAYVTDAYHSLSIEGYRVTPDLIRRVRSGDWNPDANERDGEHRNAMAARGYWQAFQSVERSIGKVLKGENPGDVTASDHRVWYREMFAPSVTAGLAKASDLAGYRNGQVFIRRSMHVPLPKDAVRDAMPAFFDLLRAEEEAAVRVVLGHFLFVYIHPYMDGNGRIARFLMNTMMASGGYPWTVIPLGERDAYMTALERASVGEEIAPFAEFLARLVRERLSGAPLPPLPK